MNLLARFVGIAIAVGVVCMLIIALVGWRLGWQSAEEFGQAFQVGGLLIVGVGLMGIRGNWEATRSFDYQYSLSASEQSNWQRIQQNLSDFLQSYAFMLVMLTAGGFIILVGSLLIR